MDKCLGVLGRASPIAISFFTTSISSLFYQSVIFPVAFLKSQVSRFDFFDNFKVTERHYDEDNNNPPPLLALQSILQLSLKQKDY